MSSMCAHVRVSLRAHCLRACASFVLLPMFPDLEFYTMGFDCLPRFGTIKWSILVKLHGEGLCTLAARVFFARMCARMAARQYVRVCAHMCACSCAHTVGAHMLVGTVSKCCALVFCAHVRRKMAGRPVCARMCPARPCARMCPCAHIVGAHMLVGTVSKNGFSLLSKPWHHYWIILSLLPPSWCGIVHFGGRVQGSAARAFFARMCAGRAARPVCRRAYASWGQFSNLESYDGFSLLSKLWHIIIESNYYYYYY